MQIVLNNGSQILISQEGVGMVVVIHPSGSYGENKRRGKKRCKRTRRVGKMSIWDGKIFCRHVIYMICIHTVVVHVTCRNALWGYTFIVAGCVCIGNGRTWSSNNLNPEYDSSNYFVYSKEKMCVYFVF